MFKFLSILGFVETLVIPVFLTHIYINENPSLRPLGTIFVALCVTIITVPTNYLLLGSLFLEKKFRKNIEETTVKPIYNIGFWIFLANCVIGIIAFIFSIILIIY